MIAQIARSAALAIALALAADVTQAQPQPAPTESHRVTLDAQGAGDRSRWAANPHVRAFYDLSVKTLRKRHRHIDVDKYEQASYAIFRELGHSLGASPEGMVEHLKRIPREVVMIVQRDPATLDSYENFLTALMGPP